MGGKGLPTWIPASDIRRLYLSGYTIQLADTSWMDGGRPFSIRTSDGFRDIMQTWTGVLLKKNASLTLPVRESVSRLAIRNQWSRVGFDGPDGLSSFAAEPERYFDKAKVCL